MFLRFLKQKPETCQYLLKTLEFGKDNSGKQFETLHFCIKYY